MVSNLSLDIESLKINHFLPILKSVTESICTIPYMSTYFYLHTLLLFLHLNMINKNENTIDMNANEKPYKNGGLYDPNIRGPVSTK